MINIILIQPPGAFEIILIIIVLLLLFGGRKIPELMRGLGQGMREFKKASRGEDDAAKNDSKPMDKGKE